MMIYFIVGWIIAWIIYEVTFVLLMSEWYITDWMMYLPVRLFIFPFLIKINTSRLIDYYKRHGYINLWWKKR